MRAAYRLAAATSASDRLDIRGVRRNLLIAPECRIVIAPIVRTMASAKPRATAALHAHISAAASRKLAGPRKCAERRL